MPKQAKARTIKFWGTIVSRSARAYRVEYLDDDDRKLYRVWLPIEEITVGDDAEGFTYFLVPDWLAAKKGIALA